MVESRLRRSVAAVCVLALLGLADQARAQSEFPYDRDMVLDVKPMRGGKRIPVLAFEEGGKVQIDLWCKRGVGQATISGGAMTIAIGPMNDESCTPERTQADEEMLAALPQVTSWSVQGDVVTLNGGPKALRFRLATH
jgi:heat shock protein HslJ